MKINTYAVNCNDAWLNTEGDDISGSYVKYKDHQAVVAELEAKCAALAAENGCLKISESDLDFMCAEMSEDGWESVLTKTPATDSFLAEVRAQGVDSAAGTIMVHMNHQHVAVAEALHILRTHAAQLRKGVQS